MTSKSKGMGEATPRPITALSQEADMAHHHHEKRGRGRPAVYGSVAERNKAHTKKKTAIVRGWRSLISIRDGGRDILISGKGVYAVSGNQKVWMCDIDGLPELDTKAFLDGV